MKRLLTIAALTCLFACDPARADYGAVDYASALLDVDRRDRNLILGSADYFSNPDYNGCFLGGWGHERGEDGEKATARRETAMLSAAMYAYLNKPLLYFGDYARVIDNLEAHCDFADPGKFDSTVFDFIRGIYQLDGVGQRDDDYDFELLGLANFLYVFRDLLPGNRMDALAYAILCHDGNGRGCTADPDDRHAEWDGMYGMDGDAFFVFNLEESYFVARLGKGEPWKKAETENHVLAIYTWNYLASIWILSRGAEAQRQCGPNPPPRSANIIAWYRQGEAWLDGLKAQGREDEFFDDILMALGRVVHTGFFETHARPYERYSLLPILMLAVHGNPWENWDAGRLGPLPWWAEYAARVKKAAVNAMNYAAADFAFRSLRAKRMGPYRRRYEHKKIVHLLEERGTASFIFGLLSGSHDFDDCTRDDVNECTHYLDRTWIRSLLFYAALIRHHARHTPMSRQSGYELPRTIHKHMFDRPPFFARMQAYYTDHQYERADAHPPPYFDKTQTPPSAKDVPNPDNDDPTEFRGSPELYFGTDDLMLAAGGSFQRYWTEGEITPYEQDFRFTARPTMLFGRGRFGLDKGTEADVWSNVTDAHQSHVLMMRGKRDKFYDSECNVWVYKNFAYGYLYETNLWAWSDFSEGWAQQYPAWWGGHQKDKFEIQESDFRIFEFGADDLCRGKIQHRSFCGPISNVVGPYYVIMSRLHKDGAGNSTRRSFFNYRRGFIEVVPGHLYPSWQDLKTDLQAWNAEEFNYFPGADEEDDLPFRYVMTSTKERLTLNPRMGYKEHHGEECINGIDQIEYPKDPSLGPHLSHMDERWLKYDREDVYIPTNLRDPELRRYIPLITVWELDGRYRYTGSKLVEVLADGKMMVRGRTKVRLLTGALVDGWDCLLIDSYDYRDPNPVVPPGANYLEFPTQYYRDCTAQ